MKHCWRVRIRLYKGYYRVFWIEKNNPVLHQTLFPSGHELIPKHVARSPASVRAHAFVARLNAQRLSNG